MGLWRLSQDRMGGISYYPVSQKKQSMISQYMKKWEIDCIGGYAQNGTYELPCELTPRNIRTLDAGWNITIRADDWAMAHGIGWDCHTLFEGGK